MNDVTLLGYVLAIFAAYRLAYLVAIEEGPFSLMARLRGHFDPDQKTWLGRGLSCVLCVSFWTSLLIVAWALLLPGWLTSLIMVWLAVAGGVVLLNKVVMR